MSYSPGWSVVPRTSVKRERWPAGSWLKALPLVKPGQDVIPDQPVMRLLHSEQDSPHDALSSATQDRADSLISGKQQSSVETAPAGLYGRVIAVTPRGGIVIEARVALLTGVIGAGKQVAGVLTLWSSERNSQKRHAIPPGAILVVAGPIDLALLSQALRSAVVGIVASSMSLQDFEGFLRADLIHLISSLDVERSQAHLPPLTILLTEGIGSFAMPEHVSAFLERHQGSIVLLSGATSIPLGIFPELLIAHPDQDADSWQAVQQSYLLEPGALVRICGGEHIGRLGIIDYLFVYEHTFPGGVRARALRLYLEDGTPLIVPLSLVERVG